jgi:hypothetical protein
MPCDALLQSFDPDRLTGGFERRAFGFEHFESFSCAGSGPLIALRAAASPL